MDVRRIDRLEELLPYRERWDELADGCVFRSWIWLTTWWQHYGVADQRRRLRAYLVFDNDRSPSCASTHDDAEQLVAVLPCYRAVSLARGRVLRLLGDGEVCSDHLDLLVDPLRAADAATALAEYLVEHADPWEAAEFSAVAAEGTALEQLVEELERRECHVTRTAGPNCWSIELPASWDEFLAQQSKSHRKQLRQLERRVLDTPQACWHLAKSPGDLEAAWSILIDLHQRRRKSLGEPGCFASQPWAAFHRDVARRLLDAGQLRVSWLEVGGQPIAAEYHLAEGHTTFAYQGGVDPGRLDEHPGRLSMICAVQYALDEGHTKFDLLRGDEPYKPHWRAKPQATFDYQIVPARRGAQWRFRAWTSVRGAGRLARQVANLLS